jgi:pimeloyl-ACP methyl ester carboxylesterase
VSQTEVPPSAAFAERFVEADGFRVRYLEAGGGRPVVMLHGAGGLAINRAHALLAARFRVLAFEVPGFGTSPPNERSQSMRDLARTMLAAIDALGLERFALVGTSFGGRLAAWLAIAAGARVEALVLVAPAAILLPGTDRSAPLVAHPERQSPPAVDPAVREKQERLIRRVLGPPRDAELEAGLRGVQAPTLVLFGTEDQVIPPAAGHLYTEIMPHCHFVFVYDAGHAIALDRPEALAWLVGEFIERKSEFVVSTASTLLNP